jgi:aspartokinase
MNRKPWIALKYGGTSVASATTWGTICERVEALLPTHRVCIAASALSKATNLLLSSITEGSARSIA